ncbi:MAG: hypothetical protein QM523_06165 [Candidatus Pacebacteria bacterium]|nr:hypothetical protein [Candidatus Paceibacterota bacterium]
MPNNRTERTISIMLFLAIVTALMVWWDGWNLAHKRDITANWLNPTIAVRNSGCAAKTGVYLVACDYRGNFLLYSDIRGDNLSPEDRNLLGDLGRSTDDMGQAFFLNMVAAISGEVQRVTTVGKINFAINMLGLMILWILVFRLGGLMGNLVLLMIGLIAANEKIFMSWHSMVEFFIDTTSHGAFFGVAILAGLPAFVLIELANRAPARQALFSRIKWGVLLALALVGFAIASMMRESLALSGFIALVTVGFFIWNRERDHRQLLLIAPLVVIAYLLLKIQIFVSLLGQYIYHLPPPETVVGHGMAFSLVTGLGVIPNGLGLQGNDIDTIDLMTRLHPNLAYGFKEYYAALSDWYLQTLITHPLEVARIYFAKLYYILVDRGHGLMMGLSVLLFWLGLRRFKITSDEWFKQKYLDYGTLFGTSLLMIMLQGVLVFMTRDYLMPITIFCALYMAIGIGRFYPLHIIRSA